MEFICLGSSSSGNAYIFKEDEQCVLVECGFKFDKLTKKLHNNNITLGEIEAVITTHQHSDHSKAVDDFIKLGIPTYTPFVDAELKEFALTSWLSVKPFYVKHDVVSCGYVFTNTKTSEKILFVNDTTYFDLELKEQFDYVFIECNHTYRKLSELLETAPGDRKFKYERQRDNHLSLIGTKKMLNSLDLEKTKAIYLMHLSSEASEPAVMKEQIEYQFGKTTYICLKDGSYK